MELLEIISSREDDVPPAVTERSISADAPMNLLLRFETANGPRTVIACSVPRHIAAEISEVMHSVGQHAEFVDRCSPLSISDRLLMKEIKQIPQSADPAPVILWEKSLLSSKDRIRKAAKAAHQIA